MQWAQSVLQAAASQAHLSGLEGDNKPRHLSTYFVFLKNCFQSSNIKVENTCKAWEKKARTSLSPAFWWQRSSSPSSLLSMHGHIPYPNEAIG